MDRVMGGCVQQAGVWGRLHGLHSQGWGCRDVPGQVRVDSGDLWTVKISSGGTGVLSWVATSWVNGSPGILVAVGGGDQ